MKRIGRYIIRGLLGRGGMAKVYRVTLPVIEKAVALKLLAPDPLLGRLLGTRRLQDLFVTEARTMAALIHPNIVAVHDFEWHGDQPFYVMDWLANNVGTMIGESYRVDTPSRPLGAAKTLDYTRQTLSGLSCLHDAGIVHRDIKPYNLLVTTRDRIKICDFGLSKIRGESYAGPENLKVGSPYYAAPEQERSPDTVNATADLYAVGIMFYRMLTGHLPAAAPHENAYRPPSRFDSDLDDVWDRFAARAMAHVPARRFASAEAMRNALNDLEHHWQAHTANVCALQPAEIFDQPAPGNTYSLRSAPVKCPPGSAKTFFRLNRLWRPAEYVQNDWVRTARDIVTDRSTGLNWQQAGSPYPRTWPAAQDYISRLNRERLGGYRLWRLPTIDELATLMKPPPGARDLCIPPVFDPTQRWIWSADRRSFTAAYYADMVLGFVGWQDFCAPYYVKAVCAA